MPPSRYDGRFGAFARIASHPCQRLAKEGVAWRRTGSPPDSSSFEAGATSFIVGHVWVVGRQDGSSASPRCGGAHCTVPAREDLYPVRVVRRRCAGCVRSVKTARLGARADEQSARRRDAHGRGGGRRVTDRTFGSPRRGTFAGSHCWKFPCVRKACVPPKLSDGLMQRHLSSPEHLFSLCFTCAAVRLAWQLEIVTQIDVIVKRREAPLTSLRDPSRVQRYLPRLRLLLPHSFPTTLH